MNNTLQIENLQKTYIKSSLLQNTKSETKQALKGINLTLENGLYGLLGPNGAGKSTLIHIITTCLVQSEGVVYYENMDIRKQGRKFLRVLGYMPQQQMLYDGFTGAEFLAYLCALKEIPKAKVKAEVKRVSSAVNLTGELGKKIKAYSGGMKQRLLAAAAFIGEPKVLVFDEPTAGLDPKERVHLRELMAEYAKNAIVLVATHVVSDVESVANEIILLKEGDVFDKGSPEELIEKYAPEQNLEQVYLNIFNNANEN